MTPSRIVAPVGSEVVVLAGICGGDGFFVKNQPLEWMLSNNSVGELVEVGGMHHSKFNQLIPPTAKKFSGQYAWGRTGLKKVSLTRGTPTPVDDIELAKGQTFVSVSSASPGTSYVTAVAPKAEGWDKRRASTIIHWVDGRWSVPAPIRATAGTVAPLTTVVSSTDDGRGLKDWEVRYAIVGGAPAEFAPSGSKTAVAKTNNDGQATVQIRQPAGQFAPGTSQVRVDIVRPAVFGESELVVESGLTTVTWSAPALTIRAIGPRRAEFDEPFNYRVEVSNPGDQISRGVVVRTKNLDDGIEFISSNPKPTQYGRDFEWQLGDIAPGAAPRIIDIQLKSKKRGNIGMCFEVASQTDRLQTDACAETEIVLPCIGFNIDGPTRASVGDTIAFNFNLENQCNEPLENVRIKLSHDPGLVRPGKSNPTVFELNGEQGSPFLQFGESSSDQISFNVQSPGTHCFEMEVTANGVQPKIERRCVEVDAVGSGAGGSSGSGTGGQAGSNNSALQISVSQPQQVEVGQQTLIRTEITNNSNTPLERVTLVNRYSPSLKPIEVTDAYRDGNSTIGNDLFLNIGAIGPGQTATVEINYDTLDANPDARSEFSVTTPTGDSAAQSTSLRILPIGALGGSGTGSGSSGDPNDPGFGRRNGNGIGIPQDTAPRNPGVSEGQLLVRAQTLNPNIQIGQTGKVSFSIKNNNTTETMKNVNVRVLIPSSIRLGDIFSDSNIGVVPTVPARPGQYEFRTIRELRAGESIDWVADVTGVTPGQALFEVNAKSDNSVGISRASDAVYVGQ